MCKKKFKLCENKKFKLSKKKIKLCEKKILSCMRKKFKLCEKKKFCKNIIKVLQVKHNNGEDQRLYPMKEI